MKHTSIQIYEDTRERINQERHDRFETYDAILNRLFDELIEIRGSK